jgi:hypothetical protein
MFTVPSYWLTTGSCTRVATTTWSLVSWH